MVVTLVCPRLTCRAVLRVPDEVRGKRVRCGDCGVTFLVPEARKSPPRPPPSKQPEPKQADTAS